MPPTPKATVLELEEIGEESARKAVHGTYADGAAALKFFDGYIAQKEKGLKAFHAEVGKNQELASAFAKDPVGMLHERGLLGPLDRLNIEGLPNPFQPLPWPFPYCHFHYVLECRWERHWVCVRHFGFRFCWPVYHLHCKWVVRIHCHF